MFSSKIGLVRRAERIAGECFFHADHRSDIAGVHFFDILAPVGEHAHDAANALALAVGRVDRPWCLL